MQLVTDDLLRVRTVESLIRQFTSLGHLVVDAFQFLVDELGCGQPFKELRQLALLFQAQLLDQLKLLGQRLLLGPTADLGHPLDALHRGQIRIELLFQRLRELGGTPGQLLPQPGEEHPGFRDLPVLRWRVMPPVLHGSQPVTIQQRQVVGYLVEVESGLLDLLG